MKPTYTIQHHDDGRGSARMLGYCLIACGLVALLLIGWAVTR